MNSHILDSSATATFNATRTHRFKLTRTWDWRLPKILFIGMNPSKADEVDNDPTIRREIAFAKRWGYGGLLKCNVLSFITPFPTELPRSAAQACLARNLFTIEQVMLDAGHGANVVAAWGCGLKAYKSCLDTIVDFAERCGVSLMCLGTTKDGSPRHPLYVKGDTGLTVWRNVLCGS